MKLIPSVYMKLIFRGSCHTTLIHCAIMTLVVLAAVSAYTTEANWEVTNPIPLGSYLNDVHVFSDSHAMAVGNRGAVLVFDGTSWKAIAGPSADNLQGVWGRSPSDIYVVGYNAAIFHYDGSHWAKVEPAIPNLLIYPTLHDVWGDHDGNLFVVGQGIVLRFDGSTWTELPGYDPNPQGRQAELLGVWGTSPSDVFVVGWHFAAHWNGSNWTAMTGVAGVVSDVHGTGPDNVYAAGVRGRVWHYDGNPAKAWTLVRESGQSNSFLKGIWCRSPSEIHAVGEDGEIVSFDGTEWSGTTSALRPWFHAVSGSSNGTVIAVGISGAIWHRNGADWQADSKGSAANQNGLWGSSTSNVYAVTGAGEIQHFDGLQWSLLTLPDELWISRLDGIWGSGPNDIFAVGYNGLIVHFNGSEWSAMNSGSNQLLHGVWGSGPDDVFAVGDYGTILHYDGSTWSDLSGGDVHATAHLNAVWGSSGSNVYAAGHSAMGELYRYDGSTWAKVEVPAAIEYADVWGSGPNDVYLCAGTTLLHYNGQEWTEALTTPGWICGGVHGTAWNNVYAFEGNRVWHYDGQNWSASESGFTFGFGDERGLLSIFTVGNEVHLGGWAGWLFRLRGGVQQAFGFFPDAFDLGNAWVWSQSMGFLYPDLYPWVYQQQHGWWYCHGSSSGGTNMWIYPIKLNDWIWTTIQTYPWVLLSNGTWIDMEAN